MHAEAHTTYPAYEGTIWINPADARVVRLEIQAREIPQEFPLDVMELTIDYSFVRIGAQDYWMPVASESLTCQRGTKICGRSQTTFRKHRKFAVDSHIVTTDSHVTFEGEPKKPQAGQSLNRH